MLDTQFASWPSFGDAEIDAVRKVLESNRVNYWTGTQGRKFEEEFAAFSQTQHAIALANGTVALDAALKALSIGTGDEVVVTPRTFLASVSSIVNAGAVPIFADIDRDSQNITPLSVEEVLSQRTKAVLCVHLAGWPCEMNGFRDLAEAHKLSLVEDCAQAHGASYYDQPVGSLGDIAAWSFCQDKIMTTGGEGGMVTTNSHELWSQMWSYKDHGKSFEAVYEREHPPGFRWLHEGFGTNWRMTEMQAVIGRLQLEAMPEWHQRRIEIANTIWARASELRGLRVPKIPAYINHAAYKCYIFVEEQSLRRGWTRDRVQAEVNELGVPCYSGSCSEVYLEKAFDGTGFRPKNRLPVAKELGQTSLMFLCHPTLTDEQVSKTCDVLEQVLKNAVSR